MRLIILSFFLLLLTNVQAQQTTVRGQISDAQSGLPLSNINVGFENSTVKTLSDAQGHFTISSKETVKMLNFSAVGRRKQSLPVLPGKSQEINVRMESLEQDLSEISVTAEKRPKYKNKDNPAVEFMRKVIENRDQNNVSFHKHIAFEEYEKLCMSLSLTSDKAKKSSLLKKYQFLKQNADTVKQPGKTQIPVFMQEKLCLVKQSGLSKPDRAVLAEKQSRIDQYLDEDGLNEFLDKVYQHIDIYDHDIGLGNQRFLSPIAELAPQFYKFFILDTLKDVTPWQVKMMVSPKNKQDVLFAGYLYISLDGHYAVQRAELSINNQINLNWVKDLQIALNYTADAMGKYHLSKSVVGMDLGIFKKGTSIFGERTITVNKFEFGDLALQRNLGHDTLASQKPVKQTDAFWQASRPETLSSNEKAAYANIDSLKNSSSFKRTMAVASTVLTGYINQGPVEIGSLSSFYSFSPVEGSRFKIGGQTTDVFSRKIFLDGHVAYGTKDKRWKYDLGVTESLTSRSIYEFPVRSLALRHSFETQIPGQDLNFLEDDNFLLSFKRGVNDKWMYNRKWSMEYLHETMQHISVRLSYRNQVMQAAGKLHFQRDNDDNLFPGQQGNEQEVNLSTSEFVAELRWAPHEKFYQGKRYRRPINNGYPVFTLSGAVGIRGFLGGDYNYENITLNVAKRFYLSQLGFSDVIVEGGAIFGKVPFPLLSIHRANQTYAYQLSSYNLMNFMEFMSDRYTSLNVQHSFNGFFLNKIPLIKKLQWREVASIKILNGTVSEKNRQGNHREHYRFPSDDKGHRLAFPIDRSPYIEGSVGLSNIFKVLRVDVVKRFTHLDNPGVTPLGIRAKLNVDF